jgi:hypothetical protein
VRTIEEYKNKECRKLAKHLSKPDDRKALEMMALTWERLAKQRERDLEPKTEK